MKPTKTDILKRLLTENHISVQELITILSEEEYQRGSKVYIRVADYMPPISLEDFNKVAIVNSF
jgi:hypothetical protein